MNNIIDFLKKNRDVSEYKINVRNKTSYELFFVKGLLETARHTETCDTEVTVYCVHDGCMGEAQFFVYPSTDTIELERLIDDAVKKAKLINNKLFSLPEKEIGEYEVESNFADFNVKDLANRIVSDVYSANTADNTSLNSVEIFINEYRDEIINSKGLHKKQHSFDAMVEAIPTYNGSVQSVELYEQYNFNSYDKDALVAEITSKLNEVTARYYAEKPDSIEACPVVINCRELSSLFRNIVYDLNYSSVYSRSNVFSKGDKIQKTILGDSITVNMKGSAKGCVASSAFDSDGVSLGEICVVEDGVALNYYGSNRYGQYLGEEPTGDLRCIDVAPGKSDISDIENSDHIEIVSMSGLQVDFYSDYIGGEVRLAYLHRSGTMLPVTGISVSGSLSDVLSTIRLSDKTTVYNGYTGPEKAALFNMKIF